MKNVYQELIKQVDSLLLKENEEISNIANFLALLKETIPNTSWIGIYILNRKKNELYLGPFQGKVACTNINVGRGVCGKCVQTKSMIIVEDVCKFEGHIACDALSRSEIVLPIIKENEITGVLDLDSYETNNFSNIDGENLQILLDILLSKIERKII